MDHHGELDETQEEEQPDYTQNHEYSSHSGDSDGRNELRSSSSQPPSEETTFENAAQPNLSDDIPPLHGAHAVGDHDHGQAIVLYEEGQHPYDQEKLIQDRKPKRNDRIAFFHSERRCWVTATLTSFELKGPNLENYYNIRYADGTEDGVYLIKDERWTFLDDNVAGAGIGQLDGGYTPESLTPSPETSPDLDPSLTGARRKSKIRSFPGEHLSDDSSDIQSPNTLDKSMTESLDWDTYGSTLESPKKMFNQPYPQVDLNQVSRLDHHLPVSSTPIPRKTRISRCRRALPEEIEARSRDNSPTFIARLNPFRKKFSSRRV